MAILTITYTPQITSDPVNSSPFICHRICYKEQSSPGGACCLEDLTASVAGTPKTFDITIAAVPCNSVPDVDPDSCENTVYTGYVQACCEDEASLAGRTPFTATFIADPPCVNKLVCCQSQRTLIDAYLIITDAGEGYDDALTPLTVVVIRDASDPVPAGGINDADVEATLSGGAVTALTVITGGLYGITPLLVIPSPTLGPPASTATAIAVIPCADLRYQGTCETSPQVVVDTDLLLGGCANMCFPEAFPFIYAISDLSGLPDNSNFNYSTGGCCDCSTCRNFTVVTGSDLSTIDLCYTACTIPGSDAETMCVTVSGSGSHNIDCAVPGSVYCTSDPNAILLITDNGSCASCP